MTDLTINEKLLIELALDRFREDIEKESDVQELLNQIDKIKQKMVIVEDDAGITRQRLINIIKTYFYHMERLISQNALFFSRFRYPKMYEPIDDESAKEYTKELKNANGFNLRVFDELKELANQ